jgi:hypothetical protein
VITFPLFTTPALNKLSFFFETFFWT